MKEFFLSVTFYKLPFIPTGLQKLPKATKKFSLGKSTVISLLSFSFKYILYFPRSILIILDPSITFCILETLFPCLQGLFCFLLHLIFFLVFFIFFTLPLTYDHPIRLNSRFSSLSFMLFPWEEGGSVGKGEEGSHHHSFGEP